MPRNHARLWKTPQMLLSILDSAPWYYLHLKTRSLIFFRRHLANRIFEIRLFNRVMYVIL
jgi:hypothetical protein